MFYLMRRGVAIHETLYEHLLALFPPTNLDTAWLMKLNTHRMR